MVNFLPIASPKITTSKKLVSQHLQPKVFPVSPPYLPISFMLFQVCLSCYIVLSTFLNLNAYVIDCYEKSWLKSTHELDAHPTFIALNKHEPL